ncbi:DUF6799 domain-containing protein [Hymenobacter algoricola]|uniref:DUF6799 domain-containing protein n=1 Tax=Hymenobacter algoricola TaxID=486267 RepID=UPI0031E81C66
MAQNVANNDGFQRRDGTMYLIRNGQKRPMKHDVHLPNGRTITRDGFVVETTGQRTELAEGRGCTLLGVPSLVVTTGSGQLALASAGGGSRTVEVVPVGGRGDVGVLEQLLGSRGRGHKGWGHYKKKGKRKHDKDDD